LPFTLDILLVEDRHLCMDSKVAAEVCKPYPQLPLRTSGLRLLLWLMVYCLGVSRLIFMRHCDSIFLRECDASRVEAEEVPWY